MAHINDQPHAIHLGDNSAAHAGDAGILALIASGGQQRLVVIGQLHEARTQHVADFDKPDIILDW